MYLGCLGCTISSLILSIIPLIISDLLFNPDIEKKLLISFSVVSVILKDNRFDDFAFAISLFNNS